MKFDLRIPLGLIFAIFGALLSLTGVFGNHALNARSLGINVNLIWGIVLLAFAAVMLGSAWRGRK